MYKLKEVLKEPLSVLMPCVPVHLAINAALFINLTVAILPHSIHFSEFMQICFTRKRTKHKNTGSLPFSYDSKIASNG